MAPPRKLTPKLRDRLAQLFRAGCYVEEACQAAGISTSVYYKWMRRGRYAIEEEISDRGERPFVQLVDALDRASGEAVVAALVRREKAARGGEVIRRRTTTTRNQDGSTSTVVDEAYAQPQWRADAWFLERRFRDRWGRDVPVGEELPEGDDVEEMLGDPEIARRYLELEEAIANKRDADEEKETEDADTG